LAAILKQYITMRTPRLANKFMPKGLHAHLKEITATICGTPVGNRTLRKLANCHYAALYCLSAQKLDLVDELMGHSSRTAREYYLIEDIRSSQETRDTQEDTTQPTQVPETQEDDMPLPDTPLPIPDTIPLDSGLEFVPETEVQDMPLAVVGRLAPPGEVVKVVVDLDPPSDDDAWDAYDQPAGNLFSNLHRRFDLIDSRLYDLAQVHMQAKQRIQSLEELVTTATKRIRHVENQLGEMWAVQEGLVAALEDE
jgi:hypothetical protein